MAAFAKHIFSVSCIILMLVLAPATQAQFDDSASAVNAVRHVNLSQALHLHDMGVVFIDVRPASEYANGHISGSLNLDYFEDFVVLGMSELLDRNTPIVLYGNSSLSNIAERASRTAADWGYREVYYLNEGYFGWMASDYPLEFKPTVAMKVASEKR